MIIGIGGDIHDSNIAVLNSKGNINLAINEERLTRTKKDGRFPFSALDLIEDRDAKVIIATNSLEKAVSQLSSCNFNINLYSDFLKRLKFYDEEITNIVGHVGHHESHAASAYYTSGFNESTIITMDGGSIFEPWCTTIYEGKQGKLRLIVRNSVCFTDYYFFSTALLGFKPNRHEGKLTGLAAYGVVNDQLIEFFKKNKKAGEYLASKITTWVDFHRKELTPRLIVNQSQIRTYREQFKHIPDQDIATTVQYFTEKLVLDYIRNNIENIPDKNLCLAGGLFGNVKLNQIIKKMGFRNIFIHPAMGDEGLSLGSVLAYLGKYNQLKPKRLQNAFLGLSYSNDEIRESLEKNSLKYSIMQNSAESIANLLAQGKVVARFDGRMEYGPRALGNRSILYQTTDVSVNDWLNKKLKRTEFMPFAPATLAEYANEYYRDIEGAEYTAQFMTITFDCTDRMKKICPGVVHVNGTARPQLVTADGNPSFHAIISEYYKLTGIPSVINTSFNNHEEPIVCSPQDAINSFKKSGLDYLAIGPFLVEGE